jgi:hypothetical protein
MGDRIFGAAVSRLGDTTAEPPLADEEAREVGPELDELDDDDELVPGDSGLGVLAPGVEVLVVVVVVVFIVVEAGVAVVVVVVVVVPVCCGLIVIVN